ncbi:MAG TPA: ABC transporter permease [bacterium]|nr:ABC transporter permease [bacterium]
MIAFIFRRLLLLPFVALGVSLLIFSLTQFLTPAMRASLYIHDPKQLAALPEIIRKYHLDQPVYVQYGGWLAQIAHGDLGWSETAREPVADAIRGYFPATFELGLYSFLCILGFGIWLGTQSAVHKDRIIDHLSRFTSISGASLPTFVWGLLLLMVFYGHFGWFAPGRLSLDADLFVHSPRFHAFTGLMTIDAVLNGQWWVFWDAVRHLVLPVATLTYYLTAVLVRITRSSMLETLAADYVRTARAKGLAQHVVVDKHARRNALIPVITLAGLLFVGLLSGVVITETVFNFPGIGRWGVGASQQLDIPAVTGFALIFAGLLVLGNLCADVLYAVVDPRIRLH